MVEAQPLKAIAGFASHLRQHGFVVGVAEQGAMVRSALLLSPAGYRRLEAAWRSLVCHNPTTWRRYPEVFRAYWFPNRLTGQVRVSGHVPARRDLRDAVAALHRSMESGTERPTTPTDASVAGDEPGEGTTIATKAQGGASQTEALVQQDFMQWLPQDLGRLERLVEAIAQRLRRRLLRRRRRDSEGQRLDLRGTLRASLKTGGMPFEPVWLARRREKPRIFVLVDVSRSMETHAQLFLRISRAFVGVLDARVFVFHTRLAEVTPLLKRTSGRVQEKVNAVTAGFGGGTRIASSVQEFLDVHAGRSVTRATRVFILSDGFDSDPQQNLRRQLERISRRGARIYWLHPTIERPPSGSVTIAADLVDAFAPVHNLDSLDRVSLLVE